MFRERYKAANNDIKPDEALLRQILTAGQQRRHIVFPYMRQLLCGTAVVALVLATVWAVSPYWKSEWKAPSVAVEHTSDPVADAAVYPYQTEEASPGVQTAEETSHVAPSHATPIDAAEAQRETNAVEEGVAAPATETLQLPSLEDVAAADSVSAQEASAVRAQHKQVPVDQETMPVNDATVDANSGSGAFESMLFAASTASEAADAWTLEAYYAYLGCRVAEQLVVPTDFSFQGDQPATMELNPQTGEPTNDWWSFLYGDGGTGSVIVATTKHHEEVLPYLENENYTHLDIGGLTAAVLWEGNTCEAYMASETIGFSIYATQLTDAELYALLESAASMQ